MLRTDLIAQLRDTQRWDMIIIGGGATGLGTAVDAAARGYKTLLLEAYDFAKGTSSRSTKLVHGGVRYLQQGNVPLVREALRERGLMQRNAPHLVHALPFVIPSYRWWERPYYAIGLKIYDLLAGKLGIGTTKLLSSAEALRRAPTLEPKQLQGGVLYYDGQFDDTRMAVALLRTFLDLGGTALNYFPVTGLLKTTPGERVSGVRARNKENGEEFAINGTVVVNATGVYVDDLRRMDAPAEEPMLTLSQGVHLVLDRSFLPGDHAIMIPRTDDGRVLFVIPWHNHVLVGTTDTLVDTASIEPRPLDKEIEFLVTHAARYLTKDPQPQDICSIFVGLRPLVKAGKGKDTAALSRDHTLRISPSGLVTVTGGKWTTYRRMGEDTVNRAAAQVGLAKRDSTTTTLKLHGWHDQPAEEPFAVYGSDTAALKQVMAEQPGWDAPLHPDLPYRVGEVVWAARYELARTVEDVLARRTRALLLHARASQEIAPAVAALMANELGFDVAWQEAQVQEFRSLAAGYLMPATANPYAGAAGA